MPTAKRPDSPATIARAALQILDTMLVAEGIEQLTPAQLERFAERCGHWLQVATKINRARKTPRPTPLRPTSK